MKTYRITTTVTSVSGGQTFLVKADNEKDAIARMKAGEAEFEHEELEVQDFVIDESSIEEVEPTSEEPAQ